MEYTQLRLDANNISSSNHNIAITNIMIELAKRFFHICSSNLNKEKERVIIKQAQTSRKEKMNTIEFTEFSDNIPEIRTLKEVLNAITFNIKEFFEGVPIPSVIGSNEIPFTHPKSKDLSDHSGFERSPKELIRSCIKKEYPLSGGWGYDSDSAVVIHTLGNKNLVDFEQWFISVRTEIEYNAVLPYFLYDGARAQPLSPYLLIKYSVISHRIENLYGGRKCDVLKFKVIALKTGDYDLGKILEFRNNEDKEQELLCQLNEKVITFESKCYFDITNLSV